MKALSIALLVNVRRGIVVKQLSFNLHLGRIEQNVSEDKPWDAHHAGDRDGDEFS